MSGFWKVCSFLCTQYLVGPPFAWITASMRRGMKTMSLWHCSGVMEAQVALIAAFRSSALLDLVSLIFLLTIPHRFSWSALKFPGRWLRWLWTSENSGPAPADDMAAQIITDCGNFTLDFKKHGFCASPHFLQATDLDFQIKCKMYFHLKRGLWTTEQQSSLFSPYPK